MPAGARLLVVAAITLMLPMSGAPAQNCLGPNDLLQGVLRIENHRHPTGRPLRAYILHLVQPACILDDQGKQHPDQREVQVAPRGSGGFSGQVGKRVSIKGKPPFEQHTAYHFRELVIIDAEIVPAR